MNTANIALEVLLAIGVITALICCLGMLLMKEIYEKLHYMAAVSTVSAICILIAVAIKEGAGQAAIKVSLIFVALLIMNAVLTHATARAARVRIFGQWNVDPNTPEPRKGVGEKLSDRARELNEC